MRLERWQFKIPMNIQYVPQEVVVFQVGILGININGEMAELV